MPFIQVISNQTLTEEQTLTLKARMGKAITQMPGKSEQWLMVHIRDGEKLFFAGSGEPCAMVQVRSFGGEQPAESYDALTAEITQACTACLAVPPDRCYVAYDATVHWGWNGKNFPVRR